MKIPTRQELYQRSLASMQSALKERGKDLPLSGYSVWAILAGVQAGALSLLYHYGSWVYRQIFPQTQDESALLLEGERFGLFPKLATTTRVLVRVNGQPGSLIPAHWQASAGGRLFEVVYSREIDTDGVLELELESLTTGESAAVQKLNWLRPLAGVENELEVLNWQAGSDKESMIEFRNRVISVRRNRPQGGSISDYITWSLQVSGINRVLVTSRQPGFVVVFALANQFGDERLPTEQKRLELEAYLNQEDLAPLGVSDVMVGIFTIVSVSVVVESLLPNTAELRMAITAAWRQYLWERFPRQFSAQEESTHILSKAEMLALAVSAGARQFELQLIIDDNKGITAKELAYNEVAELGAVVWS